MANLIIKPQNTSGDKVIIQDQAGGAVLTTADSGATIANATLTSPTLNSPTLVTPNLGTPSAITLTNATFPTGHVVGANFATTITNASTSTTFTSEGVAADVVNQITITSGNGVLIYWQAQIYVDVASAGNWIGCHVKLREGTTTSGNTISYHRHLVHTTGNQYFNFNFWAYDSSPADTTPDYCLTLERYNSDSSYAKLDSIGGNEFHCYLIEIKQ